MSRPVEKIVGYIVFNVDTKEQVYVGDDLGSATFEMADAERQQAGERFRMVELTEIGRDGAGPAIIRSRPLIRHGDIDGEVTEA